MPLWGHAQGEARHDLVEVIGSRLRWLGRCAKPVRQRYCRHATKFSLPGWSLDVFSVPQGYVSSRLGAMPRFIERGHATEDYASSGV